MAPTVMIPLSAPGQVTLTDAGTGSLSAGTYTIGVTAVDSSGDESNFDPLGYVQGNAIAIANNHNITVSWGSVSGASSYRVYVQGPSATYYQQYYTAASSPYTISANPVGPVGTLTVTASQTGGGLRRGNYYLAVSAVLPNGQTTDQTSFTEYPRAGITSSSDTGSIAVSWTAITGATSYNVYVASEQDGSPRTHTKYFNTPSASVTVTGTETYTSGASALIYGDVEVGTSAIGVFGTIQTVSNSKSFFAGDIQIAVVQGADANYQANKFQQSDISFAGLDVRVAGQTYWQFGINDSTLDLTLFNQQTEALRLLNSGATPNASVLLYGISAGTWATTDSAARWVLGPAGTGDPRFYIWETATGSKSPVNIYDKGGRDGDGAAISYDSDSTGTGAVTNLCFARIQFQADVHNHATRAGSIHFFTNSGASGFVEKWQIVGSGHLLASLDNSYDIGASGATRPRTAYLGTGLNIASGTTVAGHFSATQTLTFGQIPANTTNELSITVNGASLGDNCYGSPGGNIGSGLVWSSWVSATNTVTVRVANVTTAPITPTAVTWRVDVWKH